MELLSALAWLVLSFLLDNLSSLSSLLHLTQPNSTSFLVFVLPWVGLVALLIHLVCFVTFLLGPSFLGCLACPSARMGGRCSLPLSALFVGAPSMPQESIGLHGPTKVVDCLGNAWSLKLATKGATRPKLLWGAFLDFDLVEARDGTVERTTCNGGGMYPLQRWFLALAACDWRGHLVQQ